MAGVHQKYNALVAIELCRAWLARCRNVELKEPVPQEFRPGLERVVWPGRGQILNINATKYADQVNKDVTWFLDGAHTVESLQVCADWFQESVAKDENDISRVLIFNCTNGRDGPRLLDVIARIPVGFDHVIFTTNVTFRKGYTADSTNKTVSAEDVAAMQQTLAKTWKERKPSFPSENVHVVGSIEDAVEWIVDYTKSSSMQRVQVLTTGSLILVGNTLTALGIPPQ